MRLKLLEVNVKIHFYQNKIEKKHAKNVEIHTKIERMIYVIIVVQKKKKEKNVVLKVVQIYIIIENIMNVMTVVKQTVLNVKKMIYTKTTVMSIVVNIVKK